MKADRPTFLQETWALFLSGTLLFLTCASLYAGGDKMCFQCGAWYDSDKHFDCPMCNPPLDMGG